MLRSRRFRIADEESSGKIGLVADTVGSTLAGETLLLGVVGVAIFGDLSMEGGTVGAVFCWGAVVVRVVLS